MIVLVLDLFLSITSRSTSRSKSKMQSKRETSSHAHYLIAAIDIDDLAGNGCSPVAGEKNSRGA